MAMLQSFKEVNKRLHLLSANGRVDLDSVYRPTSPSRFFTRAQGSIGVRPKKVQNLKQFIDYQP